MDETMIHCVDDIEADNPHVIIPIRFADEPEPVHVPYHYLLYRLELTLDLICMNAWTSHLSISR
jgi:serine/threonine protein kinase HipA of HipAB toxin-antitoxin module